MNQNNHLKKKKFSMNKMLVECAHVENGVRD